MNIAITLLDDVFKITRSRYKFFVFLTSSISILKLPDSRHCIMLKRTTVRYFTSCSLALSYNPKTKVAAAIKGQKVFNKEVHEEKLLKKQKNFNNTPVKDHSAHQLLEKLLGRSFPEDVPIGPQTELTTRELISIFEGKNMRLIYKVLGTSGRQIQDSLLVDNDVQKFLERGDLLRAKQIAKMARHQGMFAYGTIIQYLLRKGQVNDAFSIFMELKKRGFETKGRFYNILISEYADSISKIDRKADISQTKIEQLYKAFQKDHIGGSTEISIIHVNSLFKVLRKGKRLDLALHLYDSLKHGRQGKARLRPDVRTYTEILRCLASAKPEDGIKFADIVNRTETVFFNAQNNIHIKVDPFLVRAYASVYVYCDDLKLRARAITILREWFRLSTLEEIKQVVNHREYQEKAWAPVLEKQGTKFLKEDEFPRMLQREDINAKKSQRFTPDDGVLRMYKELCNLFKLSFTFKPSEKKS